MDILPIFEELKTSSDTPVPAKTWTLISELIESSYVKEVKMEEDRPFVESDFKESRETVANLKILKAFLKIIREKNMNEALNSKLLIKEFLVPLLVLCGEHSEQNQLWSSAAACSLCCQMLDDICKLWDVKNVSDLMTTDNESFQNNIYHLCLSKLRDKLLKQSWKHYPAAVISYSWLLFLMRVPYLGHHLPEILPTALILVDDYELTNQVRGIQCLHHIVANTPKAELRWYGRAEVIWSALKPLLYKNEPELIVNLYPCVLATESALEPETSDTYKFSRADEVAKTLLQHMLLEQRCDRRRAYSEVLPKVIGHLGLGCVRWIPGTIDILSDYLENPDPPKEMSRRNALKSLETLIIHGWPQVSTCAVSLLENLLGFLHLVLEEDSNRSKVVEEELVPLAVKCLRLVKSVAPTEVYSLCGGMLELPCEGKFKDVIRECITCPVSSIEEVQAETLAVTSDS